MGTFTGESHAGTAGRDTGGRVQMQIEASRSERAAVAEPADVPVFLAAGLEAEGEFRCAECGYGVIVRKELPQ